MKPLDHIRLSLLVAALVIWFAGMRFGSQATTRAALVVVAVAFLLRFVRRPAGEPRQP